MARSYKTPPNRWMRTKNGEPMPKPYKAPRRLGPPKRFRRQVFSLFEIETYGLTNVRCKRQIVPGAMGADAANAPIAIPDFATPIIPKRGRKRLPGPPRSLWLNRPKRDAARRYPQTFMSFKDRETANPVTAKTRLTVPTRRVVKYIKSRNNPVLICECGNRYLKTRHGQERCLRCMAYGVDSSALRREAMVQ
jgi:hypothetical protein